MSRRRRSVRRFRGDRRDGLKQVPKDAPKDDAKDHPAADRRRLRMPDPNGAARRRCAIHDSAAPISITRIDCPYSTAIGNW